MTKITVEQAVRAVQSATTAEEVQAVLEQCKKDQLHEVFLAVTGSKSELCPKSWKKADLVSSYTAGIMRFREREEFKSKPFEEKYEALVNCSRHFQRCEYMCLFSTEEIHAAAERLGLSYDDCSHYSLGGAILRELRIRDKVQFITECANTKNVLWLKDALIDSDFGGIAHEAFGRLIAQAGLAIDEAASEDTLKMGELLYRYYMKSKELVAEVKADKTVPAHDMGFDETAYSPDVQKVSVIVDDILADHEPDVQEESFRWRAVPYFYDQPAPVQEVNVTTYEAMREAYEAYLDAEDKYLTSKKTDTAEKTKSDEAFRQYLTLLGKYRQEGSPKREEALSWIREYCGEKLFPVDSLKGRSFDELTELAHKCGIHSAFFKGYKTRHDLAVKLIREAGVEDSEKTSYERSLEERKYFQAEIHKLWQKRHALRKAQRIFGKDSADAEALSDIWDTYQAQVDDLLRVYWDVCEDIARERESIRRYETDSQLADTLAMAEVTAPQEPETKTNAPNARFSLKKKTRKTSRKVHAPSWVQSPLTAKTSRQRVNMKPLVNLTKAASTMRLRKF